MALLTRKWAAIAFAAAGLIAGPARVRAQESAGELAIKAAFLYNFTKFIDWPEHAFSGSSAAFNVCVLADEAARRAVADTMRNESVRGRPVAVEFPAAEDDLKSCHLVYFGRHDERAAKRIQGVRESPVLTIGEGRRFIDAGGHIAFMVAEDRVRFDISRRAADAAGLTVSSKLLRVARKIDPELP